LKIETFNVVPF